MAGEVAGIPLETFEEPISRALETYQNLLSPQIEFDIDRAKKLTLTPDQPNSARSESSVMHLGEAASTLYVIAFAPNDSTGTPSSEEMFIPGLGEFPKGANVMPSSKEGIFAEAHLTIASARVSKDTEADHPQRPEPVLFAGSLSLIGHYMMGYCEPRVEEVGELGQRSTNYISHMKGHLKSYPTATLTTGMGLEGKFGDPHAVFNGWSDMVQVAGFVAIRKGDAEKHLDVLRMLHAAEPSPSER